MQLYFIRHAQSVNNLLYDQTGSWDSRNEDPELTETGCRQAQQLTTHIAQADRNFQPDRRDDANRLGFGFTHIYTSLMIRAVSTAAPVADAVGLPLIAWLDLHETGGIYLDDPVTGEPIGLPGKTRTDFEARFANLVLPDSLDHTGWWNRPIEADDEKDVRAQRFLADLNTRHGGTNDRVAVVTHGAFYNRVLAALLKVPYREAGWWFGLNNTGVTRVDFYENEFSLKYLNHTDHLSDDLIT